VPANVATRGSLADVLSSLAPARPGATGGVRVLAEVRDGLEHAAAEATELGGWAPDDPLRLSKGTVTWLVRCPRRALAAEDGEGLADDLVLGLVVDAAAKLATLGARRPITVQAAVAYLTAQGDPAVADHLDDLGPSAAPVLREAGARVARLTGAWPGIDGGWWPRVEEPVRARLAGGAVTVTGRLDVLLGGPPTDRPGVVVEVKGGRWYDGMRADGHLYALLVGLRDGLVPAAVVTVVADGTTHAERIRPALVRHAGERLELAIRAAAPVAAGEPPDARPGSHCSHCPARTDCAAGRTWLAEAR
jgi:hypothetical protein